MATVARAQALQQPEQPPPSQRDQRIIAEIAAALATAATVAALMGILRRPFKAMGIHPAAVEGVAALVMSQPHPVLEGTGPASRWALKQNYLRQAAFVLMASHRVQAALDNATAHGTSRSAALAEALSGERTWLGQHMAAVQQRVTAGVGIDNAATSFGPLLGWKAVRDSHVTPDCLAADGKNFSAVTPPRIGWPGMVHARCRCYPVAPYRGAQILP